MSLPDPYAGLELADPPRARANLDLLKPRLAPRVFDLLPTALAQVPDPDTALNHLERFAREAGPRVLNGLARQPALLHSLLALFSHSRFLSETLMTQPELILWLGRDKRLSRLKSKEDLLEEYARFETAALDADPALVLARFKRREYLRIALKDILKLADLAETTLELSTLADVLLEKALRIADRELQARTGQPQITDARGRLVPAHFAVVSLGKLGGNELNYSSDVDLLFLYAGEGETASSGRQQRISNNEYFLRLAQRLLKLIAGVTPEGAVFRVDLRLRPGGGEGDVAISLPAAVHYYRSQAREWELQMLLKARHAAGSAGLVKEFLQAVEPFIYRTEVHVPAVESVLKAREQFDRKLRGRSTTQTNVKVAPGGIRDIEFLVQCLQRLHGRNDPWVRAKGTLMGLQRLYDKGYLTARDHHRLAVAYQFLRLVEHRLQLEQGRQTHTLPSEPRALELVARRCGVSGSSARPAAEEFRARLGKHLQRVQAIYERVLPRASRPAQAEEFALEAEDALAFPGGLEPGRLLEELRRRDTPLSQELAGLEVPETARRAFHRFLSAAVTSSETFAAVTRAGQALPMAVEVLRKSEPVGELLIRRPERLEQLPALCQTGEVGQSLPLREESVAPEPGPAQAVLKGLAGPKAPLSQRMAILRRYFRDRLFSWGVRELCGNRSLETGLGEFTALAEDILRAGLSIAEQEVKRTGQGLAVVALGRLGTGELDLGSDVELIFIAADRDALGPVRALVEKFLHVISGYTRDGTLFPVDTRLRPRGSEGELVQTAEGMLDYFRTAAEVWEGVTYLKARPLGGDWKLGQDWCTELNSLLGERFSEWEAVRSALRQMRQRLEGEGGTAGAEDNFKTGVGGIYDLDFILSGLALRSRALPPAGQGFSKQIAALCRAGELSPQDGQELRQAAHLLQAVDHAIRLVSGHSTPTLPSGPRAEVVAELASRWVGEALNAESLKSRVSETRRNLRVHFLRVFG